MCRGSLMAAGHAALAVDDEGLHKAIPGMRTWRAVLRAGFTTKVTNGTKEGRGLRAAVGHGSTQKHTESHGSDHDENTVREVALTSGAVVGDRRSVLVRAVAFESGDHSEAVNGRTSRIATFPLNLRSTFWRLLSCQHPLSSVSSISWSKRRAFNHVSFFSKANDRTQPLVPTTHLANTHLTNTHLANTHLTNTHLTNTPRSKTASSLRVFVLNPRRAPSPIVFLSVIFRVIPWLTPARHPLP